MLGGTRTRSRLFSTFVALALASQSLPALAQDSPDELARRHFESGVAYLQEADYESALKAFENDLVALFQRFGLGFFDDGLSTALGVSQACRGFIA